MTTKELYRELYSDPDLYYGQAEHNMCMGVRDFDLYCNWLVPPVIDLGCGTGDTVDLLNERGFSAFGVDWVKLRCGEMFAEFDITTLLPWKWIIGFNSALCTDVFEHIPEERLVYLIRNLQQYRRQVITISVRESKVDVPEEMRKRIHCNIKSPGEWHDLLKKYFSVKSWEPLGGGRWLMLGGG